MTRHAILFILFTLAAILPPGAHGAPRIGFFLGDADAVTCHGAVKTLHPGNLQVRIFTAKDIDSPAFNTFVKTMDAAVVDIMHPEPAGWLRRHPDRINPRARIYGVRQSTRDTAFEKAGFLFDDQVKRYFSHTDAANMANLVKFIAQRDFAAAMATPPQPPMIPDRNSLYHPDAHRFFPDMATYLTWYRASGRYQADKLWSLFIIFPTNIVDSSRGPIDRLMKTYEARGINTVALMRSPSAMEDGVERLVTTPPLKTKLGSITSFTFKFSSTLSSNIRSILEKADVPVFNPLHLYFTDKKGWRDSPAGIPPGGIAMQFSVPEMTGLIEPMVIGVKDPVRDEKGKEIGMHYVPVPDQCELMARRTANWHRLKTTPNRDKRVVILYYNHGAGKQNIGASYLNVAKSITAIIHRLKKEGYAITAEFNPDTLMDLLVKTGRNIGSWAPGELDRLVAEGNARFVEMDLYKEWLKGLDPTYAAGVKGSWGEPEASTIMTRENRFIQPCITLGNLTLVPQPSRGWGDDPDKLFHSTTLFPHHQYTAFYLWLQKVIDPHAMISLGTHGTHEWLPGKQAGLTRSCPPQVLLGTIPNLYPYIVDDVGEGLQAKRRGSGVIIDHNVPAFKRGGLYAGYSTLAALISEYESTPSEEIKAERLKRIGALAAKTGIDKALGLATVTSASLEGLEHYLLELKTELVPFGLHTFGRNPAKETLAESARAISPKAGTGVDGLMEKLKLCGPNEMASLVRGLNAGYIPPGSGNGPVRNPDALPTGRNFYAFDPDKVPSKAAWEAGKKAGRAILDNYMKNHGNRYPEQVAILLWAVETIRNEGINPATALFLMGMEPVWDHRDKVKGVRPMTAQTLQRPRIDVLLQMSGLFRDSFPNVALLLDRAVNQAARMTDLDNFIAKHAKTMKTRLLRDGVAPETAEALSLVRLFSEKPGAYGTKVSEITASSGMWENTDVISEAFVNAVSHGYSAANWGQPMTATYRQNLKRVDAAVHSISSSLYGTMNNDDLFQYLGGLSMAVKKESGLAPDMFISRQQQVDKGSVEPLGKTLSRELAARYLNPKWIQGMKNEGYAGAREMEKFVEYMWGWQVTTPELVDNAKWDRTYDVYVEDGMDLDLKAFFDKHNPWAYQSMAARMLETGRKGYWDMAEEKETRLAKKYALSVVKKGVACCEHTCNNPLLNQMVMNLISIPGVLPDTTVKAFKMAVEQATGKTLANQAAERKKTFQAVEKRFEQKKKAEAAQSKVSNPSRGDDGKVVKGYKMEERTQKDDTTEMTSSGAQWLASLFSLFLVFLVGLGVFLRNRTGTKGV
ncbi:MAG: cobaltochelatase subunit CobN [Desulfobacteraceae bacterium]|nr:cobaltochelatase subunit CobN [Desulfobacteraceae bacterium]